MLEITISQGPKNNPTGRRVSIPASVDALRDALDAAPSSRESWWSTHVWSGDRRQQAAWQAASGVMVDIDYHDAAGKHVAVPADEASRFARSVENIPGNLWHPSPRGARIIFLFAEPCADSDLFARAARGAGVLVERAIKRARLNCDPSAQVPGYEVDGAPLEDRARFMYCPRAVVDGVERDSSVSVLSTALFYAAQLAEAAPRPATVPNRQARPARQSASSDIESAVAQYNRDHAREFPRSDGECPICGHRNCFGRLPDAPGRWACWSASHPEVGIRGERCYHGDVLDIDAHDAGRSRVEHLRAEGYLATNRKPQMASVADVLDRAARTQERPEPPHPAERPAESHAAPTAAYVTPREWPDPEPLTGDLLPVVPMQPFLLPDGLRAWVADVAERAQAPLEYPAAIALVEFGMLIGRRCGIRPKAKDDWLVIPNLWGAIVGPPSQLKSPMASEMLKPLKRLEAEAFEQYEKAMKDYAFALDVAKAEKEAARQALKKAIRDGGIESLREDLEKPDPKPPACKRLIVNDATIEKLGELLNENPRGLLQFRDELQGWLATMTRDGHENDRSFYLESWNGTGSYTYDRIGRGTVRIDAACLSVFGTTQPGPFRDQLKAALNGGAGADGLIQRFQVLVFPDVATTWQNVDRYADRSAKQRAWDLVNIIDQIDMMQLGACTDEYSDEIPHLRFAPAAQEIFDAWREDLENRIRDPGENQSIVAHLSKYRKLMPAIALICHIVDAVDKGSAGGGAVSEQAALMAVAWCEVLESHARRLYSWATDTGEDEAVKALAAKIQAGALGTEFRARDVYRKRWAGLGDQKSTDRALRMLAGMGWLRASQSRLRGQHTVTYMVNPKVCK
jgi:hypothetical protein